MKNGIKYMYLLVWWATYIGVQDLIVDILQFNLVLINERDKYHMQCRDTIFCCQWDILKSYKMSFYDAQKMGSACYKMDHRPLLMMLNPSLFKAKRPIYDHYSPQALLIFL